MNRTFFLLFMIIAISSAFPAVVNSTKISCYVGGFRNHHTVPGFDYCKFVAPLEDRILHLQGVHSDVESTEHPSDIQCNIDFKANGSPIITCTCYDSHCNEPIMLKHKMILGLRNADAFYTEVSVDEETEVDTISEEDGYDEDTDERAEKDSEDDSKEGTDDDDSDENSDETSKVDSPVDSEKDSEEDLEEDL